MGIRTKALFGAIVMAFTLNSTSALALGDGDPLDGLLLLGDDGLVDGLLGEDGLVHELLETLLGEEGPLGGDLLGLGDVLEDGGLGGLPGGDILDEGGLGDVLPGGDDGMGIME